MPFLVVCPLNRVAETAVRHRAGALVSLLAEHQALHRPGLIAADNHLQLGLNDIAVAVDGLVLAQESHVRQLVDFVRAWDQTQPLLIHCWMGVSRSPAAALIAALSLDPDLDDAEMAQALRRAAPFATPNPRLIQIGDALLGRNGALVRAVKSIGRGADTSQGIPFVFPLQLASRTPA
jgi:predicted protein tyrosine phosphatase